MPPSSPTDTHMRDHIMMTMALWYKCKKAHLLLFKRHRLWQIEWSTVFVVKKDALQHKETAAAPAKEESQLFSTFAPLSHQYFNQSTLFNFFLITFSAVVKHLPLLLCHTEGNNKYLRSWWIRSINTYLTKMAWFKLKQLCHRIPWKLLLRQEVLFCFCSIFRRWQRSTWGVASGRGEVVEIK